MKSTVNLEGIHYQVDRYSVYSGESIEYMEDVPAKAHPVFIRRIEFSKDDTTGVITVNDDVARITVNHEQNTITGTVVQVKEDEQEHHYEFLFTPHICKPYTVNVTIRLDGARLAKGASTN